MIRAFCAAMLLAAAAVSAQQPVIERMADVCPGACYGLRGDYDTFAVGTTRMYFVGSESSDYNLDRPWVSDGTAAGTFPLAHIPTDGYGVGIRSMVTVGDVLFFTARTAAIADWQDGRRLWRSDRTAAKTAPVDFPIAAPKLLQPVNDTLYATSRGVIYPGYPNAWWVPVDGATPRKLVDGFLLGIGPVERNGIVYFLAAPCYLGCPPGTQATLYRMDAAGAVTPLSSFTAILSDGLSAPVANIGVGTAGVFVAPSQQEVWYTDGTSPLSLVKRVTKPAFVAFDYKYDASLPFVFSAVEDDFTGALWTSDGTAQGTGLFTFLPSLGYHSVPAVIGSAGGMRFVHVPADSYLSPYPDAPHYPRYSELGVLDLGAPAGVRAIRSMAPPSDNSYLSIGTPAGDRLIFTAVGQVWVSDGTAGGTQPIDPSVFGDVAMFGLVGFVNGALYFKGWEKDGGTELYRMTLPPNYPTTYPSVEVTEYYHTGFDHYFVTADEAEKARLDSGATKGWTRTGFGFTAYAPASGAPRTSPVCRYYGRPEAGLDSHFYSASPKECADVAAKFPASWAFESSDVFDVEVPDAAGRCVGSLLAPIYRAFNGRSDANHRYSVWAFDQKAMQAKGWQPEGATSAGFVMCALAVRRP